MPEESLLKGFFGKLHFQDGCVGFFVPTDEDVISTEEKSQDDHAAEIGQPVGEKDRHSHQAGQSSDWSIRVLKRKLEKEKKMMARISFI